MSRFPFVDQLTPEGGGNHPLKSYNTKVEFLAKQGQEIPMKRLTYSEQQIVKILKEAKAGVSVEALSRQYGFLKSTFYK